MLRTDAAEQEMGQKDVPTSAASGRTGAWLYAGAVVVGAVGFSLGAIIARGLPSGPPGVPTQEIAGDDVALQVNSQLPNTAVHSLDGKSIPITSLLASQQHTVLVIFSFGCRSCIAEAAIWDQLAQENPERHRLYALACTLDHAAVRDFRADVRPSFSIWLCDDNLKKRLGMRVSPLILDVDQTGSVLFTAAGLDATERLEEWLSDK